jgi:hypothetical protein
LPESFGSSRSSSENRRRHGHSGRPGKEQSMKQIVVRYKVRPDAAPENQRLIENVFADLRAISPEGVRYLSLKLADGTFIHFAMTEEGAPPIPGLEAFRAFQSGIKERCSELPQSADATIVGNYRMLRE